MSAFEQDKLVSALLVEERARAERLLNVVRAIVLVLMTGAAMIYAPSLTPALVKANAIILSPMLLWTVGQQLLFYGNRKVPSWLSAANVVVDVTAVTALQASYGIVGHPMLGIHSPVFLAYFAILAARPIAGALDKAVLATVAAVLEYTLLITFFVSQDLVVVYNSPMDLGTSPGITILDEGARVFFLAVAGAITIYVTLWNERILRRTLAAQVQRDSEERDLTARLQEADKLAGVGALAAATVHEIRNPLTVIAMHAELLKDTELNQEQREDIDKILVEAQRTGTFVADLLRVARRGVTEGQAAEERTRVSLNDVVRRAMALAHPLMHDQRIRVEIHSSESSIAVMGSPIQLERVILNLVFNAAQAMELTGKTPPFPSPQTKHIAISVTRDTKNAIVKVQDNGPGIPDEIKEKIFERFFTTKPSGKGTGLGLWIISQIIESHGGAITVADNPNGPGALFTITVPLAADAA